MFKMFGVMTGMIFTGSQNEVRRRVVKFIPVFMVNNLARFKSSAEKFLHDGSMLKDLFPIYGYQFVSLTGNAAFAGSITQANMGVPIFSLPEIVAIAHSKFFCILNTVLAAFFRPWSGMKIFWRAKVSRTITNIFWFGVELITTKAAISELSRLNPHGFQYMSDTKKAQEISKENRVNSVDPLTVTPRAIPSQAMQGNGCMEGVTARQMSPNNNSAQERPTVKLADDIAWTAWKHAEVGFKRSYDNKSYMRDTLNVPYWEKNTYAGILSTKACRGIKNDPNFQFWRQYLQPGDVLMNSEIGQVEQIRIVESNNTSAFANNKGTGSVLGEAVIFGKDAVAMVEAEPFELRRPIPADAGRFLAVLWYGIGEWGPIWASTATAGEARIVRVTSS